MAYAAGTMAVFAFVILSAMALVWANGLQFNSHSWNFEKTVLVAIEGNLTGVTVKLNSETVAGQIPYRARNLPAGRYAISIEKDGFNSFQQTFWLDAGQVGLIKDPILIAKEPLITISTQPTDFSSTSAFDPGLSLSGGELQDRGIFVTRFSTTPSQVHRIVAGYLYQTGLELRIFFPAGNQDYLVYTVSQSELVKLQVYSSTWQLTLSDGDITKLVSLTIPSH